jgi:hypothetical protein
MTVKANHGFPLFFCQDFEIIRWRYAPDHFTGNGYAVLKVLFCSRPLKGDSFARKADFDRGCAINSSAITGHFVPYWRSLFQ